MANFKRYTMVIRRDENGFATPVLKVRQHGECLKFEEVKEFLKPTANTAYQQQPLREIAAILNRVGVASHGDSVAIVMHNFDYERLQQLLVC